MSNALAENPEPFYFEDYTSDLRLEGGRYLVTFVSSLGSYAALVDQNRGGCVAWMEPGSYTGGAATFGLAPEAAPVRNVSPAVPNRLPEPIHVHTSVATSM